MTDESTTEYACILCSVLRPTHKPRHPNNPPGCDGCRGRVREDLAGIPADYATLPDGLEPGRGGQERGARGFGSRLPLSLGPLDLTGPGSVELTPLAWAVPSDQIGQPPPLVLLDFWALDWIVTRDMRETPPLPRMEPVVAWLLNRLDWALDHHPAVDEFAGDVHGIARAVRAVSQAGQSQGESADLCPVKVGDGGRRCGTKLYVDPYVHVIECSRCRTRWRQAEGEWLTLRGEQLAATEEETTV